MRCMLQHGECNVSETELVKNEMLNLMFAFVVGKMKNLMQSVLLSFSSSGICHICLQKGKGGSKWKEHKIYGATLQAAAIIHQNLRLRKIMEEEAMWKQS